MSCQNLLYGNTKLKRNKLKKKIGWTKEQEINGEWETI
jgi:hypothetical protein